MEDAANDAAIQERRVEIRASLRNVENSLRDAGAVTDGYASAYFLESNSEDESSSSTSLFRRKAERVSAAILARSAALRFDFDPPDQIRHSWKLTPLGEAKCRRIWSLFDEDQDDAWAYEEFQEYLAALTSSKTSTETRAFTDSEEVWRMYMSDVCELDDDMRLTFEGFKLYRERIEDEQPLARDLALLGVSLQWEELEKSKTVKELFQEYMDDLKGGLTAKSAQYFLAELGFVLTCRETLQIIERRYQYARCLKSILQLKRTLRLFGFQQKSALRFIGDGHVRNTQTDEQPRICEVGLSSLIFSSWIPPAKTHWRNLFLRCRLRSYCALRRLRSCVSWAFQYVRQAATTGLLSASCLQSRTFGQDRGDYLLKMDVGPSFSTNATVHLTYNSDADSAATLHELKYLERGAECFVYIDFTCRGGIKENDAHLLVNRLTWFVGEFFGDHIEALPFFHRWFVTLPTKPQLRLGPTSSIAGGGSSSTVVRLVILLTGKMDLYHVMQTLGLPSSMQFDHLLQRLSLRWLCSHSLEELLVTKSLNVGSQWCCRTQLDVRLNRQAWAQILTQFAHQLDEELAHEREDAEFIAQAKAELELQNKNSPGRRASVSPLPHSKIANCQDNHNSQQPGRGINDMENHQQLLIKRLRQIARVLEHSQHLSSTSTFTNLSMALGDNQWFRSILSPHWFSWLKHVLQTPGGLATQWKSAGESLRAEFAGTSYASANSNRPGLKTRPSATTIGTPVELNHLPVPMKSESAFPTARLAHHDPSGASNAIPEFTEEEAMENSLLECYDLCARHLQGVHVVRAEAGTSGVTCVLEGWNFFSLLPRIRQSHLAKKTSLVRTLSRRGSGAGS